MQISGVNCSITGCTNQVRSLGMCRSHYEKNHKYGDPLTQKRGLSVKQRLLEKVEKTDACWLWTGAKNKDGYGQLFVDGIAKSTHRISWEVHHGAIPDGLHVLHKCDNPPCVNPDHLFLGTNQDNVVDRESKGRNFVSRNVGISNPSAKITQANADEIRDSNLTQKELAAKFGVSISLVSAIKKNKVWRKA